MRKVLLILCTAVCAVLGERAAAQGINNVRINEVLVQNDSNLVDSYGDRSSWIELHNSGYEMVNIAACHIGVTRADGSETIYKIPANDPATVMHSQTYNVFFCEGTDTKGTFYTNFLLDGVTKITFYNQGRNVVDEFTIDPAAQTTDVSMGYMSRDGISESVLMRLPRTTPGATNETTATVSKDELFRQRDSSGGVMAIIAMSVVFFALVLIFFVLKVFGMAMVKMLARKEAKAAAAAEAATAAKPKARRQSAEAQVEEELAAVALALRLYQEEQHILESTVITINRASRVYSPWSSKFQGITAIPNKK